MSTDPQAPRRVGALDIVTQSFESAWEWTKHVLWKSPDAQAGRWLHWGGIAFLAGLGLSSGTNTKIRIPFGGPPSRFPADLSGILPEPIAGLLQDGTALPILLGVIAGLSLLLGLAVHYLRARFRLVMLDNVLTGRPRIRGPFGATSGPAHRYLIAELALWLLALPLAIAPLALTLAPTLISLVKDGARYAEEPSGASLFALITFSLVWCLPILLLAALASGVLHAFVVPYWHRGTSLGEGLARAWRLIVARPAAFLIFAGLRFVAGVAAWLLSLVAAVVCCCVTLPCLGGMVGFSILSTEIPFGWLLVSPFVLTLWVFAAWLYSSILAPVPVLMRGWSYEFLRQLDPELPPLGRPPAASDPGV